MHHLSYPNRSKSRPKEKAFCRRCGKQIEGSGDLCFSCLDKRAVAMRIIGLLRPFWKQHLLLWVLIIIGMAVQLVRPYLVRPLVDEVLAPKLPGVPMEERLFLLGALVLALLGAQLLNLVTAILKGRLLGWIGAKVSSDLRERVFNHLQTLSLKFFNQQQVGGIMSKVIQDTDSLRISMLNVTQDLIVNLILFGGICVVLFTMNWRLTLYVLIPVPFVVVFWKIIMKKIHLLWKAVMERRQDVSSSLNETLSGIRVVKAFAKEKLEMVRFGKFSADLFRSSYSAERASATYFPILSTIIASGGLIVWYFGGKMVVAGEMTLGVLMAFVAYLGMFYGPIRFFSGAVGWLIRAFTAAERVFNVLDEKPDVADPIAPVKLSKVRGDLTFKEVTFSYQNGKAALADVDIQINAGEMIGLVGHSGAGKSTLVNLVCRFYDVDKGEILLDGINLKQLGQSDLRSRIGVVLQNTFLFNGSIFENIAYSKPNATNNEVVNAARIANAEGFILEKPDGYNTIVGERGVLLSSGELQRITLARAILHDPAILILDEATSSVDLDTEKDIQEAIERLVKGRTTIAIAHRLSTLRFADRLVVLNAGRIAEVGTHEELLANEGEFSRLVDLQRKISEVKAVDR